MSQRQLFIKYWYIDLRMIAQKSNISYGMLRHYRSGSKQASDERLLTIKIAIKEIAKQMAAEILEDIEV